MASGLLSFCPTNPQEVEMANDVFANGREISCKAADGKSVAAFPDVCFTPPECPATPPGVPIPYPNTAFAKDTSNGSKTVKISGKEVMLKNQSYFKKSTGDEPGCASKKGVVTSVNKGKAYFISWSMNVKFEGKNVVRHLDLTTHNHGSQPGNTPPWVYADTALVKKTCADERRQAEKKCEPTAAEKKDFKEEQERRNERLRKKGKRAKAVREMGWKDAHCTGIMKVKPYTDIKNTKKALEDSIADVMDKIDDLEDILIEKGIEIAKDKAEKVAVRAGAKYLGSLIGGPFAPALAAISTVVTVVDGAYSTVTGAMEAYDTYKDMQQQIGPLEDLFGQAKKQLAEVTEGADLLKKQANGTLTEAEARKLEALKKKTADAGRKMADAQAAQAMADPCLRALKCTLTPYEQKQGMGASGNKPQQEGCCPGQTGHHIPPKGYFKECPSYDMDKALSVCAEGVDQRSGSHGRLHDEQDRMANRLQNNGELSFDDAIDASVAAHGKAFKASKCDPTCIREQLESSLKKCKDSKVTATDKEGGSLGASQEDN